MDKKILVLADPTSIHTKKWIKGWEYIGYQTVLSGLTDKKNKNKNLFYAKISSTGGNGIKYIKNILNFSKVLKNEQFTIINTHYMSSYGLIGALIKQKKHKLVLFLPGSDVMIDMNRNFIYSLMAKFVLYRTDVLVSVSETMTNKIVTKFPSLHSKILTQQYGVDIQFLNKFFTKKKEIDVITNRQWKPNSNYPVLLNTFASFQTNINFKLIGYDKSSYAKELLDKYKSLIPYSVGIVSYEENLSYVSKSKIFISLTSSDGIPLSLIEAIYLGAIPIVSDIEPNRELIKDGINGFIVSITKNSLQKKIEDVLQLNKEEIEKIQQYNKNLVLKKFDFKKNFQRLEKRLKENR